MEIVIKSGIKRYFPYFVPLGKDVRGIVRARYTRLFYGRKPKYKCPICGYSGPFADFGKGTNVIRNTECPRCGLYERHRLQYLVIHELAKRYDFSKMSILHFAPELHFERIFSSIFAVYHTADIVGECVDFQVDICHIPFENGKYDVVFASHVLEHVKDDNAALSEINRVLKPGGFAILPVPVISPKTLEYGSHNPYEFNHVRAIGMDYFDKYERHFSKVEVWDSNNFDQIYQLWTYEDRSGFPSRTSPIRMAMSGLKHIDYVPVCYK
jgi:SAM-dependent methyltransferase